MWYNVRKGVFPTSLAVLFLAGLMNVRTFFHYPTRYYSTTQLLVHYPTLPYPKLKLERPLRVCVSPPLSSLPFPSFLWELVVAPLVGRGFARCCLQETFSLSTRCQLNLIVLKLSRIIVLITV